MKTITMTLVLLVLGGAPGQAMAEEGEYLESGPEFGESFEFNFERTHDRGLYARVSAGLGWVATEVVPPAALEVAHAGVGLTYGAHLGALALPQFSLHLSQWGQVGPERGFLSLGPGLTFYFEEDDNTFLSVAAGATTLYDAAPDLDPLTQWGLGGEVEVGMGWWVAAHSSLGVSLVGGGSAFDLDGDGIAGAGWYASLRMTFAFN